MSRYAPSGASYAFGPGPMTPAIRWIIYVNVAAFFLTFFSPDFFVSFFGLVPKEILEWSLARIRQLSAHEVGHTLGIGHNYYDSKAGRISVLDYPHPLVTLKPDGSLDYSQVYATGIGEWDKIAIRYGYSDFAKGTDQKAALDAIIDEGHKKDLYYLTNQDLGAHANVNQWSNGTNAAEELDRMMKVRAAALLGMPIRTFSMKCRQYGL